MMRRFMIEITQEAFDGLAEIAHEERRPVKDQGAVLLERAIREIAEKRAMANANPVNGEVPGTVEVIRAYTGP